MINVTIWNEFLHEKKDDEVKKIYPAGIHQVIADGIRQEGLVIRSATCVEGYGIDCIAFRS